MSPTEIPANLYVPAPVEVVLATREAADVETFRFEMAETGGGLDFAPGQFVVLSILGVGECPVSISSSPTDGPWIELTIRRIGSVTGALYAGPPKGALGLRGPLGTGFDLAALRGRPLLCVAGGIGLAPLRSLIRFVHASRQDFGPMAILYGAREPGDRLYRDELQSWGLVPGNRVLQIVEGDPEGRWRGPVGTVAALIDELGAEFDGAAAVLGGPFAMFPPVIRALQGRNVAPGDIQVAMERRMSCGVGKCGHCYVGEKLVCVDGPVFTVEELRSLGEPV